MTDECPRCGFLQPKDRYCANCGLDIENYNPTPPPWHLRLVKSTSFQMTLAFFLIGVMVFSIFNRQSSDELSELRSTPSAEKEVRVVSPSERQKISASETRNQQRAQQESMNRMAQMNSSSANAEGRETGQESQTENAEAKAKDPVKPLSSLSISFFEVPMITVEDIFSEGEIVNEGPAHRVVSLKLAANQPLINRLKGAALLPPGIQKRNITRNRNLNLDYLVQIPQQNFRPGLFMQVVARDLQRQVATLEVEGVVTLRGQQGLPPAQHFLDNFVASIGSDEVLLIVGWVPHRALNANELRLFTQSPISIMASEEFLESTSEFVVAIQPQ